MKKLLFFTLFIVFSYNSYSQLILRVLDKTDNNNISPEFTYIENAYGISWEVGIYHIPKNSSVYVDSNNSYLQLAYSFDNPKSKFEVQYIYLFTWHYTKENHMGLHNQFEGTPIIYLDQNWHDINTPVKKIISYDSSFWIKIITPKPRA